MHELKRGGIAVIDYGSQYTQLIARRIRELGVYSEVFAFDGDADQINRHEPAGYILSGGPNSVYAPGAPQLPDFVLVADRPVLGICYGMQLLTDALGGRVSAASEREYGPATITHAAQSPLLDGLQPELQVWMSHGDRIEALPPGFKSLARSSNSPQAAIGDLERNLYGVQFHPEVQHSAQGSAILSNFVFRICGCLAKWSADAFIRDAIGSIRAQVRNERVLLALSGGVDSAVTGALIHRAIGDQLTCVFVDHGLLRKGEAEQVVAVFRDELGMNLIAARAVETFLSELQGVTEPEAKRKIIGKLFVDTFSREARRLQGVRFLAQGTIYPDVIESAADSKSAKTIK